MLKSPAAAPQRAVVQIHPTRHCNLACLHCYSSSGRGTRARLPPRVLLPAISDAARFGYATISISGGEPLLYPELFELLLAAKNRGLSTSVVTNGFLIGGRLDSRVAGLIDTLVLSIDGPPELHNELRGDPTAFDTLCAAIRTLQRDNRSFGLIHTVTQKSWHCLEWLVEFAQDSGAQLLQLHPLESAGRAAQTLLGESLDSEQLLRLFIAAPIIQSTSACPLSVHADLVHVEVLRTAPELFYRPPFSSMPLPLISPLVIEEDATVTPYVYGLHRSYCFGSLAEHDLGSLLATSEADGTMDRLAQLCASVRQGLFDNEPPVVNWHATLYAESHRYGLRGP